jgi:hypothetical protein
VPDVLAAIRPDSVNLPLFLHVLGAMVLVGALALTATALLLGWRDRSRAVALTRFGLRVVPWAVLPAYVVMRVGAQWTEAEQGYPEGFDPAWIGVGYVTADLGALLLLVSLILGALGLRKLRAGGGLALGRAVGVISVVVLVAYVVAVWAMTAKPG